LILGRNITGDGWGFHFRPAGATSQELRSNVPMDYNWHMLGFRYKYNPSTDRCDLALIFDGQIVATGTSSTPGRLTNIYRLYSDGNNYAANCLIDELLILPYAASDEIIAELYRQARPLYDEWVPLGVFWSTEWNSEELEAMVRARDRMELLRRTTYEPGPLKQNVSLYELAQDV